MSIGRHLRDLLFSRPVNLRDAVLQTVLVYIFLMVVLIVGNFSEAALWYATGHPFMIFGTSGSLADLVLMALPVLPLFWIRASLNLNLAVSFLGLALFWTVAFWDRRFMTATLSDGERVLVALAYVLLWAVNRVSYWRGSRKKIS